MSDHIYMIPTHRQAAKAIDSLSEEVVIANEMFGLEIPMVILYSSKSLLENEQENLSRISKQRRVDIILFCDDDLMRRLTALGLEDEMLETIFPPGISYGAARVKCFIAAASLGCSYIHFRDSDVRLINRTRKGPSVALYPLIHELQLLGQDVDDLRSKEWAKITEDCTGRLAYTAGSWSGDPPIDVSFMSLDEILNFFGATLDQEFGQRLVQLTEFIEIPSVKRIEAEVGLWRGICVGANFSIGPIYRWLPCPTIRETLGVCDYFLARFVFHVLKLPSASHNAAIGHYRGKRSSEEYAHYWTFLIRELDLDFAFRFLFDDFSTGFQGVRERITAFAEWGKAFLNSTEFREFEEKRKINLRRGLDVTRNSKNKHLREIALASREEIIIQQINKGLYDYFNLLLNWHKVVSMVKEIAPTCSIRSM